MKKTVSIVLAVVAVMAAGLVSFVPFGTTHAQSGLRIGGAAANFGVFNLPGGFMPDKLRRDPHVLQIVRDFASEGKLVAAICHGGWIPISAGVYRGVRVTGSPGIKDDLVNAGAIWEDASVVIDRNFVCSRKPDDLPDFCRGILQVMQAK